MLELNITTQECFLKIYLFFWNAGVNLLIPVNTKMTLSNITYEEPDNNGNYYYTEYYRGKSQTELLKNFKTGNIFKINIGIGYIF
jgi:hypothetical protein